MTAPLICSRLTITGSISERTPLIVIQEIASAHRIHYEPDRCNDNTYIRAIVRTIYNTPVYRVNRPFNIRDKDFLLRYLDASQDESWTLIELDSICDFWDSLTNQLYNPNFDLNSIVIENIGPVTRNCHRSLNACFLYCICKRRNLEVPFNVSLEQLACMAKFSAERINNAVELINSVLLRGNVEEILPLIGLIPNSYLTSRAPPRSSTIINYPVTYDSLIELSSNRIFSNPEIRRGHKPINNCEAIALASLTYGINLFYAGNPLSEFFVIRNSGLSEYQPIDEVFKEIYLKNPNLISVRIFEPRIPQDFYSSSTLLTAIENEGYLRPGLNDSLYEFLQLAYVSETFHMGWFPNIRNQETPFLEESVNELPREDLICFGCRSDTLVALELSEITSMLSSTNTFRNQIPSFTGFFSDIAIRKLRLICQNLGTVKAINCIRQIDAIESLISTASQTLINFVKSYSTLNVEQQNLVQIVLNNLLHLSMYMRGWNGISENYPIIVAPVDNQSLVDIRVTEAINKFELSVENCPLSALIRSLPLIKYDHNRFTVSNDIVNGRNLGERINMMKRGENANNVNSCIRLTSNWLAASSYRYYQVLKLPVPFEIENLRWIT